MKKKIEEIVYDFFLSSTDFNGIPLRRISEELKIEYTKSIDLIKELVLNEIITIQSSTNPHIIRTQHYPIKNQLSILEDAKNTKITYSKIGEFNFAVEDTEFPICLYPTKNYLKENRDLTQYGYADYTKQLALGEPQLKPLFFDIEVIDRYFSDPRYDTIFNDYSGRIYCKYDEEGKALLREEDQIFIKTFGLGFDDNGNRLAVVYLRYLKNLTTEHQIFWKGKEIKGNCKILEEYYKNTIIGDWAFSHSIFSAFLGEIESLNNLASHIFGIQLFSNTFKDEKRPKEFTFFFTPTLKNYESFVSLLDKMISENINKGFFKDRIDLFEIRNKGNNVSEKIPKGTLRLFEEWLLSQFTIDNGSQSGIQEVFKPLKNVRKERQNPAHKINENEYDKKYIEKQKNMITDVYLSIKSLRKIFQQHRDAKGVEIPGWLDKDNNIKMF
ncbi:hypothetical protein G7050_07910 [Dysgonomonas sp. HDW5A]|uniref:hypothetical protein n=1 Tax=Dysgonomonas sp. HDW5A TaxID=2714926 RepID=UPI00140733C9|nr:hypothetical protein [Dysgonomonas sp. HDW5A]QIK59760.1 hypothetical protein G7050_07910 [Dysgonomonas sp. HDW5A]